MEIIATNKASRSEVMKLLIVDDSSQVRGMIKRMVADLSGDISECDDGAQAVDVYTAQRPDWVLMDLAMKRVNGITATEQIKLAFPEANILIVTSHDDAGLRAAAQAAGACGYVLKENLLEVRGWLRPCGA